MVAKQNPNFKAVERWRFTSLDYWHYNNSRWVAL